ncbi:RNA polymerase sigma-70 factor [Puteibacter caeruleilacunae]|nr:RNA polymerase sigma-70 factor [Puteibacter caeruleilacunae]
MEGSSIHIDHVLIKRLKKGDSNAFEIIFESYKGKLLGFVSQSIPIKEDAEGIVQEVFIKLWLSKENIDLSQSLNAYIYTIARNQVYDHLRKLIQKRKYIETILDTYRDQERTSENNFEYLEFERYLYENINNLPERTREIFKLAKLEGKKYNEIAAILDISEHTVDKNMRKANSIINSAIKKYSSLILLPIILG